MFVRIIITTKKKKERLYILLIVGDWLSSQKDRIHTDGKFGTAININVYRNIFQLPARYL